jgi:hypothetical protein
MYCTQVLRLSAGGAYNRIEAARAARRFPVVLDLLARADLNLGTLRLLIPHLTAENHGDLFAAASGKSKREVEALLARMFPKPDVPTLVRKLPVRKQHDLMSADLTPDLTPILELRGGVPAALGMPGGSSDEPVALDLPIAPDSAMAGGIGIRAIAVPRGTPPPSGRLALVAPLSADRYQIRFTASAGTYEKLRRAQDLLRHAVPSGEPAEIFDRALTALLKELERRKFAATERPRRGRESLPGSRTIPAAVKRSVKARDQERCAFVAEGGQQCGTRAFLEFHHIVPYAHGGPATDANIQLRCRAHNGYEADLCFGKATSTRPGTSWGSTEQTGDASAGEGRSSAGRSDP